MLSFIVTTSSEKRQPKLREGKQWKRTNEEPNTIAVISVSKYDIHLPSNAVAKR